MKTNINLLTMATMANKIQCMIMDLAIIASEFVRQFESPDYFQHLLFVNSNVVEAVVDGENVYAFDGKKIGALLAPASSRKKLSTNDNEVEFFAPSFANLIYFVLNEDIVGHRLTLLMVPYSE